MDHYAELGLHGIGGGSSLNTKAFYYAQETLNLLNRAGRSSAAAASTARSLTTDFPLLVFLEYRVAVAACCQDV